MLCFQLCFHACAGVLAMGNLLLSNSTCWAHYADQEAQPHCIYAAWMPLTGGYSFKNSAILATTENLILCRAHMHREKAICPVNACLC